MASLKKRGNYWSIVFKKRVDGKPVRKTYALGTKYKKFAKHKQTEYEKLYQSGEIDPFDPDWNLKEYEKVRAETKKSTFTSGSYFIQDLKEEFLKTKSHTSDDNIKQYNSVINLFSEYVGRSMPINKVIESDIRTFCLQNRLANATQRNYLRHLKAFFKWQFEKEVIENNPCQDIKPPKKKDKLVDKVFGVEVLNKIFRTFRDYQKEQKSKGHIKDYTQMQFWFKPLVTTGYYTGQRRKELRQLKWEDVDLEAREMLVTDTKNGKERTVVIFDPVYDSLKAWNRFLGNPTTGLVFQSPRSKDNKEIPLSADTVTKVFKDYVRKANIKDSYHLHCLRHSCATFMLRKGFDVTMVKDMLGHENIEVTMGYVNLVANDRKNKAKELGLITT